MSGITNMDSLRYSTSNSKQFYFCYSYIYYMITQFVYNNITLLYKSDNTATF